MWSPPQPHRCSICHQVGHNRRNCPKKPKAPPGESLGPVAQSLVTLQARQYLRLEAVARAAVEAHQLAQQPGASPADHERRDEAMAALAAELAPIGPKPG